MGTYSYPIKKKKLIVVHCGPDQRKTIRPVQIEKSALGIPLVVIHVVQKVGTCSTS